MSDEQKQPEMRMRTAEKTQSRGSVAIAMEDSIWNFFVQHMAVTGLTKNGVIRKALSYLKRAVEEEHSPAHLEIQSSSEARDPLSGSPQDAHTNVDRHQSVQDVIAKIERIKLFNTIMTGENLPHDVVAQYHALRIETIESIMPLLDQLAKAGLLVSVVEIDEIEDIQKYSSVYGDATATFSRTRIFIESKHGGGFRYRH
ncbi:hypothetical protein [Bradyrhizobium sp. ERR14]|uniref:hypothetical protein n=1 Tax=Bradyrhizobium sp. ERR14 TaxID=2663837 RepID=UPI001616F5FF|nr:hypothetical protein [Bradyrhizobium sp. ERR14]MBB4395089.1 hypothetical protein [Bradyrhizobium sp. ERR14]